ncbi:hypothetical protein B0H11DRAFT_1950515 [Mycena galericulata]|nr:hypothetical protein B0H11DRAFT_1950515 [Mycena galericulata]
MPAPKSKTPTKSTHEFRPKTRAPLPISEQLKRLFKTLCSQIDGGHHLTAIRTCDKVLHLAPADPDALQTKLFLLLTTDQPAAAIALIESLTDGEGGAGASELKYTFERAYALYCLHKKDEARTVLAQDAEEEGVDARGVRHLEAQLNYRDGAYQAAFDIYNELLDSAPTPEEHADILTNLRAASAHLDFINTTFLHSLDALPAGVQAGIEDAGPVSVPTSAPAPASTSPSTPAPAAPATQKRKPRLPPGVVPGVTPPPDPERWLKKSERTGFGTHKRRKGAQGQGGGGPSQGAAVDGPVVVESKGGAGGAKGKGKKRK